MIYYIDLKRKGRIFAPKGGPGNMKKSSSPNLGDFFEAFVNRFQFSLPPVSVCDIGTDASTADKK